MKWRVGKAEIYWKDIKSLLNKEISIHFKIFQILLFTCFPRNVRLESCLYPPLPSPSLLLKWTSTSNFAAPKGTGFQSLQLSSDTDIDHVRKRNVGQIQLRSQNKTNSKETNARYDGCFYLFPLRILEQRTSLLSLSPQENIVHLQHHPPPPTQTLLKDARSIGPERNVTIVV